MPLPLKSFSQKVAVLSGASRPLTAVVCLKLLQLGTRVLLVENESESESTVARDLNLLWAGVDLGYCNAVHADPWGARAAVGHLNLGNGTAVDVKAIVERCMEFFDRQPDFVMDVSQSPIASHALEICQAAVTSEGIPLCIQSWMDRGGVSEEWLNLRGDENLHPDMPGHVRIYTRCNAELIQELGGDWVVTQLTRSDSDKMMMCTTDDMTQLLSYFLHRGRYIKASTFELVEEDAAHRQSERCRISMKCVTMSAIDWKSEIEEMCEGPVGSSRQRELEIDESALNRYDSAESDLINNGTFDALLQKSKDYPIDWCQGGSEGLLALDDMNLKIMSRAVVNFTFRWLVLGYFVIGFAVPKALGWNGL